MSNPVVYFWEFGNDWGEGRFQSTLGISNRGHGRRNRHHRQRRNGRRRRAAAVVVVAVAVVGATKPPLSRNLVLLPSR